MFRHLATAILLLLCLDLKAQTETLYPLYPPSSSPRRFAVAGDTAWFIASPEFTQELWTTDGTPAGTLRFAPAAGMDIYLGPVVDEGTVYFVAGQYPSRTLWQTDGTAEGTLPLFAVPTGTNDLIEAGGALYLAAWDWTTNDMTVSRVLDDASGAIEIMRTRSVSMPQIRSTPQGTLISAGGGLWRTDGTAGGTAPIGSCSSLQDVAHWNGDAILACANGLLRVAPGGEAERIVGFTPLDVVATPGGELLFLTSSGLWRTDGTSEGTALVVEAPASTGFALFGDRLIVRSGDGLWSISASADEPVDLGPAYDVYLWPMSTGIFFQRYLGTGPTLWRTDGTVAGTSLVKDFSTAENHGSISGVVGFGARALVAAYTDKQGNEPWITDGTADGTVMLANIAPDATIRGRVTDAGGEPVPDAIVEMKDRNGQGGRTVRTGADGWFTLAGLPRGTYTFRARAEGKQSQLWNGRDCSYCPLVEGDRLFVPSGSVREDIHFSLKPGGKIRGYVLDTNGEPITSALIWVGSAYREWITLAEVQADGSYEAEGLPAGQPLLVYSAEAWGYSHQIYDNVSCAAGCTSSSEGTRITLEEGEIRSGVDFILKSYGTIRGRVLNALTGLPITDGSVHVKAYPAGKTMGYPAESAWAWPRGEFEITLRDGRWNLLAVANTDDFIDAWYPNLACAPCSGIPVGTVVSAVAGESSSGFDIVMTPASGSLHGRVLDGSTSAPMAGVTVTLHNAGGAALKSFVTPGDGNYALAIDAAGTYYVKASPTAPYVSEIYHASGGLSCVSCPVTLGTPVTLAAGQSISGIDFRLDRAGSIAGRVRDAATSLGVAGITVNALTAAGVLVGSGISVADGSFAMSAPAGGPYYLITAAKAPHISELYNASTGIHCLACSPTSGRSVTVLSGRATTGINFSLERFGAVRLQPVDSVTGQSLRAQLKLTRTGYPPYSVSPSASGQLSLGSLMPGSYSAEVSSAGWKTLRTTITVPSGATASPSIKLAPGCTMYVTPTTASFTKTGGNGSLRLTTSCTWAVFSNSTFVSLTKTGGSGSASIPYTVLANTTRRSRTATIVLPGKVVTVKQAY